MLEEPKSVMCFPPDRVIISFAMRKVQKLDYVLNVRSQRSRMMVVRDAVRFNVKFARPRALADFCRLPSGVPWVTDPLSGRCPEPMSFDV